MASAVYDLRWSLVCDKHKHNAAGGLALCHTSPPLSSERQLRINNRRSKGRLDSQTLNSKSLKSLAMTLASLDCERSGDKYNVDKLADLRLCHQFRGHRLLLNHLDSTLRMYIFFMTRLYIHSKGRLLKAKSSSLRV